VDIERAVYVILALNFLQLTGIMFNGLDLQRILRLIEKDRVS